MRFWLLCIAIGGFVTFTRAATSLAVDAYHPVVNQGGENARWRIENHLGSGRNYGLRFDPADHSNLPLREDPSEIAPQILRATLYTSEGEEITLTSESIWMPPVSDQTAGPNQIEWVKRNSHGILKDDWESEDPIVVVFSFHPGKKLKVNNPGHRNDDVLVVRVSDEYMRKIIAERQAELRTKKNGLSDLEWCKLICEETPPGDATEETEEEFP